MPITMSAHGNAFYSEQVVPISFIDDEGRFYTVGSQLDSGVPRGWGRTFRLSGWYHIAITNITHYETAPMTAAPMFIDDVLILISSSGMNFNEIHIWEGGSFLWTDRRHSPRRLICDSFRETQAD